MIYSHAIVEMFTDVAMIHASYQQLFNVILYEHHTTVDKNMHELWVFIHFHYRNIACFSLVLYMPKGQEKLT